MNTIKLNNTSFELTFYQRNVFLHDDRAVNGFNGGGACRIILPDVTNLADFLQQTITSIQIYHDDNLIYNLSDTNCEIVEFKEFTEDGSIIIELSLKFIFDNK